MRLNRTLRKYDSSPRYFESTRPKTPIMPSLQEINAALKKTYALRDFELGAELSNLIEAIERNSKNTKLIQDLKDLIKYIDCIEIPQAIINNPKRLFQTPTQSAI
jgi:hypothetical protein